MCIRDRAAIVLRRGTRRRGRRRVVGSVATSSSAVVVADVDRVGAIVVRAVIGAVVVTGFCLLYPSDAADDLPCVDLGGRRIIKKKHIE